MEESLVYQMALKLQSLNQKRQEELVKKNEKIQKESLYKCSKCRDTGWILRINNKGDTVASSCDCREKEKIKNQWIAAGINLENKILTFKNFIVWNDSSRIAKDTAIAYYNDFSTISNQRKNSIIFCGQVGSGKTHLAVALAINFMNKGMKVIYMPYRDIITKIKQNIMDNEYYKKLISKFQTCEILLIDDLFKGKVTDADINIMFEIINYRYLNHLPIIVNSEFIIDKLLYFDEAVGSRIYEMCKDYVVEIKKDRSNNFRLR